MKYPQLVSPRAVNAISDWLVSRLEQLGVEAPQIYSRLLLSLLQSSVQINDPIEFSNLETFFANRKGSNRRYPPCEPNTLKKINAVQCLREIVSSEHEISTIEILVDELFEKLIAIEQQSTDRDQSLFAELSVDADRLDPLLNQPQKLYKHHKDIEEGEILKSGFFGAGSNTTKSIKGKAENRSKEVELSDNETDPKKRYFRAFPALTKEMEDSFRVWRRNTKSLTWPVDKSKISKSNILGKDSSLCLETNSIDVKQNGEGKTSDFGVIGTEQKQSIHGSINNNENVLSGVVKRKSRRRRHRGLSKVNNRKTSSGNGNNGKRRSSSPFWDTDFEGCWEMGRDLIKEFLIKENNRNRSTSDSAVYSDTQQQQRKELESEEMLQVKSQQSEKSDVDIRRYSPLCAPLDISLCCNMEKDDKHSSVSATSDAQSTSANHSLNITAKSQPIQLEVVKDDRSDVEQFKAKFDSSLEALWKSIPDDTNYISVGYRGATNSMSTPIMQLSAPSNSLQNFWSNYYTHRYEIPPETQNNDGQFHSLCCSGFGRNINSGNDYYSMPYNLKQAEKPFNVFLQNSIWSDGSHGLIAKDNEASYRQCWNAPQKTNPFEVLRAQMEETEGSLHETGFQLPSKYGKSKWSEGINAGPNASTFTLYPASQFLHVQLASASSSSSLISTNSVDQPIKAPGFNADKNVADSATSASTTSCSSYSTQYNWQTPLPGQSLQPDMQSWSCSNPMSLTEMYGSCEGKSDGKRATGKLFVKPPINESVSLPNHCSSTSGFIEYARIKLSSVKAAKHDSAANKSFAPKQPQQFAIRTKECYAQDEDLLNSDVTHFRPIKPYEDGHSFYICSALDVVEYERSESGYLYLESEKYLEYTRKDPFLAEEDQSISSNGGAPLYASSSSGESSANTSLDRQCGFVMKFRLRNCDAACQTEDKSATDTNVAFIVNEDPLTAICSSYMQTMQFQTNNMARSDAIKALSKAVVAAVSFDDTHWQRLPTCYHSANAWPTKTKDLHEADIVDEVDFQTGKVFNALDQWSMHEIGKRCEQNHDNNAADSHTLWGMCAACNNDINSIPADRLLKDELQLEADEIMSDLKYMQDLYIGESKWNKLEHEGNNVEMLSNTRLLSLNDSKILSPMSEINIIDAEEKELLFNEQNNAAQNVFKKVNRLIADLLCQDNCKRASCDYAAPKDVHVVGNFRNYNDEINIWKQDGVDFKSIDMSKGFNNGQRNAAAAAGRTEEDQFLAKLSWEHDNLAEIWEKGTPPVAHHSNEMCKIESQKHAEVARENVEQVINVPSASPVIDEGDNYLDTGSKYKGSNRKRRHSASQSVYLNLSNSSAHNNNNDLQIADLNQLDFKPDSCNSKEIQNNANSTSASEQIYPNNSNANTEESASNLSQPQQTIITCKYWTIDPTMSPAIPDILQGAAFSCLLNKNASILKHVTMISRPLTR